MVTSRLFPPGTIYASALTPVIVAAVSEMLSRSHERMAQLRAERRTMVLTASGPADADAPNPEHEPAVRRYRRRAMLHPKVWIVTGVTAFAIAIAALTLPELIFGGAVANDKRTTFFGGRSAPAKTTTTETQTQTQTQTTTEQTVTETAPAQTPPTATETATQTTPTETTATQTTPTETAPGETAPQLPTP